MGIQETENGKQKTENGKQKTENGKQKTENWGFPLRVVIKGLALFVILNVLFALLHAGLSQDQIFLMQHIVRVPESPETGTVQNPG